MNRFRTGFATELFKVAKMNPMMKNFLGTSALIGGLQYMGNPDGGIRDAAREGVGFGGGDILGTAIANKYLKGAKGFKPGLARFIAGMIGGSAGSRLLSSSRKPEQKKPSRRPMPWDDDEQKLAMAATPKTTLTPGSSNVKGYRYDKASQQLFVTYQSGGTYRYDGVPPNVARSMARNKSPGKTVNKLVKAPGYEYEKVGSEDLIRGSLSGKKRLSSFDPRSIAKGVKVELQRTDDPRLAAEIVMDRLAEDPGYYDKIEKRANGDMLEYLQKHPEKAKEREERQVAKAKTKRNKGNPAWGKNLTAQQRFVINRGGVTKKASPSDFVVGSFSDRRRHVAKLAGACKKQVTWNGLTMKLEYLDGDERSGVNGATGKKWSRVMKDNYGYMPGTYGKGADGEAIDVYFSPEPDEGGAKVHKIRQKKKTGEYDEDKFMVGYGSSDEARRAFLRNMPEWAFGSMTTMSMTAFRRLVGQPEKSK